ncbi:MAG: methionyl-tRNA formyltransferase [Candidatus Doudnabacteria bacterium]|nr:methionyl-tRNA formyltransferase [Candidatus Doudnabacteria bacterium]
MKIVFIGTSDFGIPTLQRLTANYQIPLVVTRPDRPVGRRKELTPPPLKIWAEKNNIRIEQPEKITNLKSQISNLQPDLILVAAYGQLIPKDILDISKFGAINIHASLLPKYRGATPIQNAILSGEQETGITLIKMDEQLDHGPIVSLKTISIANDDNYTTLHEKLAVLAASLVSDTLPDWFGGKIKAQEQDHSRATYTKIFATPDGKINWSDQARNISRKIRALNPNPGTWTTLDQKNVKILSGTILNHSKIELAGKLYRHNGQLAVKCHDYSLLIDQLIPEGKKLMTGSEYLNGIKNLETKIFL